MKNHATRQQETAAVKAALRKAGLPVVSVTHGRGTGWGWLDVTLRHTDTLHTVNVNNGGDIQYLTRRQRAELMVYSPCVANCKACDIERKTDRRALEIVQQVTGRHGEYDGRIIVQFTD